MPTSPLDDALAEATRLPEHRTVSQFAAAWAQYPIIWSPRVSPDGRWLAWTWTGPDETGNVWIAATDGTQPPRRLTDGSDHFYVRGFSKDGTQILLAQSIGSSERDRLFLGKLPSRGREAQLATIQPCPVTALQDDYYVFGGCFAPDGKTLYYAASMDPETGKAIEGQHIIAQDLETGAISSLAQGTSLDEAGPRLSPSGRHLLYHRHDRAPGGSQVWVIDLDAAPTDDHRDLEVINLGDKLKARAHWLTDDLLLVLGETEETQQVGIFNLHQGKLTWLVDKPHLDIEAVIPGHDGRYAAVIGYQLGVLRAVRLEIATGAETPFKTDAASLLPIAELPDGSWVAEGYSSREVHHLIRVDLTTDRRTDLSHSADRLEAVANGLVSSDFVPAALYRWQAVDGLTSRAGSTARG